MKRSNKILAVAVTLVLLGALLLAPAHAAGLGGITDILGELFNRWSQGDPNQSGQSFRLSDLFNNPEAIAQIREALSNQGNVDEYSDGQILQAITALLNGENLDGSTFMISDLLSNSTLGKILALLPQTTPVPTTEPTTLPTTTETTTYVMPVVTLPPTQPYTVAPYVPSWSGAATYSTTPYVIPTTEPSYVYVEPSTQVVPQLTTAPVITPVIVDDEPLRGTDDQSRKMIAGGVLVIIALAAVVVVAIMLRKNSRD